MTGFIIYISSLGDEKLVNTELPLYIDLISLKIIEKTQNFALISSEEKNVCFFKISATNGQSVTDG